MWWQGLNPAHRGFNTAPQSRRDYSAAFMSKSKKRLYPLKRDTAFLRKRRSVAKVLLV